MTTDIKAIEARAAAASEMKKRHWLRYPARNECACLKPWPCDAAALLALTKQLAEVVEAAEVWRGQWVPVVPDGASSPQDMGLLRAIDAYREATR